MAPTIQTRPENNLVMAPYVETVRAESIGDRSPMPSRVLRVLGQEFTAPWDRSDRLLVLSKDNSGKVVAIARTGQVKSTFEAGRFEHLLERFAIAYEQIQLAQAQQKDQEWER